MTDTQLYDCLLVRSDSENENELHLNGKLIIQFEGREIIVVAKKVSPIMMQNSCSS